MPGFNNSQALQTPASSLHTSWTHPRFLRAIPSLMVLTTAIAWGASSHAGGLALDGALRSGTGVNIAAGPALGAGVNADVRIGANSNVTAEQRMSAMGAVGGGTDAQMQGAGSVDAAGAVTGAAEGAGRTAGGVRDSGEAVGSAAARTGKRAAQGAKAEASGGLKGSANAMPHGASIDSHAGAGTKGVLTTR